MDRATELTRHLKRYDRELYCSKNREGKLCVYRNSTRWETFNLRDGSVLRVARPTPFFILALTHNWSIHGLATDWGSIPLLDKIKTIDGWHRDISEDLIDQYEREEKDRERDTRNNIESFLYDFRGQFKKTFSDTNVSNLKKVDSRNLKRIRN